MAKFLAETNPYLVDPKQRAEIIQRQVIDSNAFEGLQGLGQRLKPSALANKIDSLKQSYGK